jgi:hypothetical protein
LDTSEERRQIESEMVHLRSGDKREWSDFPETADLNRFEKTFIAEKNRTEHTLFVHQQDVKQAWVVVLNDKKIGDLALDENDMIVALRIPAETLIDGKNLLRIAPASKSGKESDDIRVGQIEVVNRPVSSVLSESTIEVDVIDADEVELTPCRITVVNAHGALQSLGNVSDDHTAVRPGVVYSSTGRARLQLPAGHFVVYAGRGFEYSIARAAINVASGETVRKTLGIRREVATEGYIACDTHVHTLTFSGHGDATIDERMITIAGEGVELPVATDHNKHVSYQQAATKHHVQQYFTPVIGNEVTTPRGHFNVFPIAAEAKVVDHQQTDWKLLFDQIQKTPGVKVAILNHARDLHSGVRPFGPDHHNAVVGENLDGWPFRFNAMEVVNSGAVQTDPMRLFHDWMGLLNRGLQITPVGSSDSHDVARYIIGQGRTYIRCDDRSPGTIDVDQAIHSFVEGKVLVSYGLLTELIINRRFRSGETATNLDDEVKVDVRILGPHWSHASHVQLFANGTMIREAKIPETAESNSGMGLKWAGGWTIPKPRHDVHLVAIATGPGIEEPYWRMAKPYQPTSIDWTSMTIGCSGAVWLDGDNDDQRTSARTYAEQVVADAEDNWTKLVTNLSDYDEAVAAHAAHLLRTAGTSLQNARLMAAVKEGSSAVRNGFQAYQDAARENEIARSQTK